jgi:hypothetical protein
LHIFLYYFTYKEFGFPFKKLKSFLSYISGSLYISGSMYIYLADCKAPRRDCLSNVIIRHAWYMIYIYMIHVTMFFLNCIVIFVLLPDHCLLYEIVHTILTCFVYRYNQSKLRLLVGA